MGSFNSIAIDIKNYVHISYYDKTNGYLKYTTNTSGSWIVENVDSAGGVGEYNSIAVANNKIHISYYDRTNGDLKYATKLIGEPANNWVKTMVDGSTTDVGQYTSIAVDSSGYVHISYYDITNGSLKYASNNNPVGASAWKIQTITGAAGVGTSIAVNNDGVHIAYRNSNGGGHIEYVEKNWSQPSWTFFGDISVSGCSEPHIALDNSGKIYVCYRNGSNLVYITNANGSATPIYIDTNVSSGSLFLRNNYIYASYSYISGIGPRCATNRSGTFVIFSFFGETGNIKATSIAVDSSGKIHISYYDSTNGDLKYLVEN